MKILTLSDEVVSRVYAQSARTRYHDVDLVLGCGDLPYYYLEYVVSTLDRPTFFVRGNHEKAMEYGDYGGRSEPHGATDLHLRVTEYNGLLLAGVEGCLRYRPGPYQYTQSEMWFHVLRLVPGMLRNRLQYGRFLDVFVSHAPPWGLHDQADLPHNGIKAFRWLDQVFHPALHFHGHIHVYRNDTVTETWFGPTRVVNTYGQRVTIFDPPGRKS